MDGGEGSTIYQAGCNDVIERFGRTGASRKTAMSIMDMEFANVPIDSEDTARGAILAMAHSTCVYPPPPRRAVISRAA